MSWNIKLKDVSNDDEEFLLERALSGITHSAVISKGDWLDFTGIKAQIVEITHKHVPPLDRRGAVSEAICITNRELSEDDKHALEQHGFERRETR